MHLLQNVAAGIARGNALDADFLVRERFDAPVGIDGAVGVEQLAIDSQEHLLDHGAGLGFGLKHLLCGQINVAAVLAVQCAKGVAIAQMDAFLQAV